MRITIKTLETETEVIATCPELDINCYGPSKNDAIRRLVSVLHFYIDAARDLGLDVNSFDSFTVDDEPGSRPLHTAEYCRAEPAAVH